MRNQPVTPSKDNPIFYLWNAPLSDLSHKNWKHPNIRVMARTFMGRPDSFIPSGYSTPSLPIPSSYPLTFAELSGFAVATAQIIAHFFHAGGLIRGYGSYNSGLYDGAISIQNFGYLSGGAANSSSQNITTLVGHPHDRIPTTYRSGFLASTSGRSPYNGYTNWATGNVCDLTLIMTSGIQECSGFSNLLFSALKNYCDSYTTPLGTQVQLCYPKFIHNDGELLVDNLIYYQPSGGVDIGHRLSLQRDPRYSTATIYQTPNGTGWNNITMSGAEALCTLNLNPVPSWFIESSSGFIQWWYRTSISALSYGFQKGYYEPAKAIFPYLLTSNYHAFEVPSGQYPHVAYLPRNWERVVQPVIREDCNSPDIYPAEITGPLYSLSTLDGYENNIYFQNQNNLSSSISGYSTKILIPWIISTGSLDSKIYVTEAYLGEILKSCYDNNVSEYIIWGNPSSNPVLWTDDAGFRPVEYLLNYFARLKSGSSVSGFVRKGRI